MRGRTGKKRKKERKKERIHFLLFSNFSNNSNTPTAAANGSSKNLSGSSKNLQIQKSSLKDLISRRMQSSRFSTETKKEEGKKEEEKKGIRTDTQLTFLRCFEKKSHKMLIDFHLDELLSANFGLFCLRYRDRECRVCLLPSKKKEEEDGKKNKLPIGLTGAADNFDPALDRKTGRLEWITPPLPLVRRREKKENN